MIVIVGDFQVGPSMFWPFSTAAWHLIILWNCYLKAVCNHVVELMHNTVIQHVPVLFNITDYSFSVLKMNQHMTCGILENHWNQFSCSWLRFKFFVIEQDVCFHYAVPYYLTSLISVQFRKSNHHGSIASDFWSLPNLYSFTLYTCFGAHVIKKTLC
jgi:hypothetical protein